MDDHHREQIQIRDLHVCGLQDHGAFGLQPGSLILGRLGIPIVVSLRSGVPQLRARLPKRNFRVG